MKTATPHLVRIHRDLASRLLRVLVSQEVIPPEVSWISSCHLLLLALPSTKSIGLLLSAVGDAEAEEGWWEAVDSAKRGKPSDSTKVHLKAGA